LRGEGVNLIVLVIEPGCQHGEPLLVSRELREVLLEIGADLLEMGVVLLEMGADLLEMGVVLLEMGVVLLEMGAVLLLLFLTLLVLVNTAGHTSDSEKKSHNGDDAIDKAIATFVVDFVVIIHDRSPCMMNMSSLDEWRAMPD
jgi:hypothetical protein